MTQSSGKVRAGAGFLILFALSLAVRAPDLDSRMNADVDHWNERTTRFWTALEQGRWDQTFQSSHPGVTLMWIAKPFMDWMEPGGAQLTVGRLVGAKVPIAVLGALLGPLTALLLLAYLREDQAALAWRCVALISTEPFLVAHSRSFQLDSLTSSFAWLTVMLTAIGLRRRQTKWIVASGVAFGFCCLSKVSLGPLVLGVCAWILIHTWESAEREGLKYCGVFVISASAVGLALWPALLTAPWTIAVDVLGGAASGAKRGHLNFLWGEVSRDPGALFYPTVLGFRLTPEVLFGAFAALLVCMRSRSDRAILPLFLVYLPVVFVLVWGAKKGDRYILFLFPPLCLLAASGLILGAEKLRAFATPFLKHRATAVVVIALAILLALRVHRLYDVHPHPIAWCAKYPGVDCGDAFLLGWGEGMKEAALWIKEDAGPRNSAAVVYPYPGYTRSMRLWYQPRRSRRPNRAEYLIRYRSEASRGVWVEEMKPFLANARPLWSITLDGRVFVEIFAGPRYRDL